MNPAVVTGVIGIVTLLMGLGALAFPEFVMARFLGYAVDPSFAVNFVHGEVRAAYGGIFTVIGIFTLLSARSPWSHRGRLLVLACLWLGLGGGRLTGAFIDGSPGAFGWLAMSLEFVVGAVLAYCSQAAVEPPAIA